MKHYKLIDTGIQLAIESKYLLDFYPELAKYDTIRKLVKLSMEWNSHFDHYVSRNTESCHV